jgi:hypothetical protein
VVPFWFSFDEPMVGIILITFPIPPKDQFDRAAQFYDPSDSGSAVTDPDKELDQYEEIVSPLTGQPRAAAGT